MFNRNGYSIRGCIVTRKLCRQLRLLILTLFIDHSVQLVGGDRMGGYRYFSQLRVRFIRVHENLVQHPSNNISISIPR